MSAGPGTDVTVNCQEQQAPSDWVTRTDQVETDANGDFQLPVTPGGNLQYATAAVAGTPPDLTPVPTPKLLATGSVWADATAYRMTAAP